MPLDEFQKGIVAVISSNRGPQNAFTGGSVIQQHGFRFPTSRTSLLPTMGDWTTWFMLICQCSRPRDTLFGTPASSTVSMGA